MLRFLIVLFVLIQPLVAIADSGMIIKTSPDGVAETQKRLLNVLKEAGMHVIATVDHAEAAQKVGLELPSTTLIIFGNPKVGTKLMQCARSVAIDLPMKMLVWEEDGVTKLAYNDAKYLAERHQIEGCDTVLEKVGKALNKFALKATNG